MALLVKTPVTAPPTFQMLLSASRQGDGEALDALTRRFYPTVQRIVHHRLATDLRSSRPWLTARFSTGDVVQEVFGGVIRDLATFAGSSEESFIGYLVIVIRNRIMDTVRFHEAQRRDGRRTFRAPTGFDVEGKTGEPVDEAMRLEQEERVFAALEEFDLRERLLLRARFEDLASFRELTEQLGYGSESATRRAFFAAQARLALSLGEGEARRS